MLSRNVREVFSIERDWPHLPWVMKSRLEVPVSSFTVHYVCGWNECETVNWLLTGGRAIAKLCLGVEMKLQCHEMLDLSLQLWRCDGGASFLQLWAGGWLCLDWRRLLGPSLYWSEGWCASKLLPRVRVELTTFRLWDWRAAYCANEATGAVKKTYILRLDPPSNLRLHLSVPGFTPWHLFSSDQCETEKRLEIVSFQALFQEFMSSSRDPKHCFSAWSPKHVTDGSPGWFRCEVVHRAPKTSLTQMLFSKCFLPTVSKGSSSFGLEGLCWASFRLKPWERAIPKPCWGVHIKVQITQVLILSL